MDSALITPGLGVIFWMVVSFAILVFILLKFGWPIILKTLNERESAINDALLAADKAKEEMQQLKASNEDLLREAKLERDEMLRNARLTSEKIIEDSKIKATEEADRIVEMARQSIEYEKMEALHELKNQMANLSIEIAEKLLKEELADKERANAFIKQELEDVNLK
jgi:F-type H+-transporting ATPase subunit b